MREDQKKRIEDLQEKLVEVLLLEADPQMWPGDGVSPADLTRDERGDRYWCKKNAAATLTVLTKTMSLTQYEYRQAVNPADSDEADMDQEIARHEKEAEKRLQQYFANRGPVGNA